MAALQFIWDLLTQPTFLALYIGAVIGVIYVLLAMLLAPRGGARRK